MQVSAGQELLKQIDEMQQNLIMGASETETESARTDGGSGLAAAISETVGTVTTTSASDAGQSPQAQGSAAPMDEETR